MPTSLPPVVAGLSSIAHEYDYFILDLWGTLHDGVSVYPDALNCLDQIRRTGGKIALLSNVPARVSSVRERIAGYGLPQNMYDLLRTSGEEAFEALTQEPGYTDIGSRYYLLGPEHFDDIGPGTRFERADNLRDATFILCTAPHTRSVRVEDEMGLLSQAAEQKLPMICVNPDLSVMRGDRSYLCAGAIARAYEDKFAGRVIWHGKPYRRAFSSCLAALGASGTDRVIMVGDTLHTDIAGGKKAGMGTLLIGGGIHATTLGLGPEDKTIAPDKLANLLNGSQDLPDAVLPYFCW